MSLLAGEGSGALDHLLDRSIDSAWRAISGPDRTLDLNDETERRRAYEIVLREGTPADIETTVDGLLLIQAWPHLVVPADLRAAWQSLIDHALDPDQQTAA